MPDPPIIPACSVGGGIFSPLQTVVLREQNPGIAEGQDLLVFASEKCQASLFS